MFEKKRFKEATFVASVMIHDGSRTTDFEVHKPLVRVLVIGKNATQFCKTFGLRGVDL